MSRAQWGVVAAAPFIMGLQALRLRRLGYRETLAKIPKTTGSSDNAASRLQQAQETEYAVRLAMRAGPWRPRCLLRSLTLAWFLSRQGIAFHLRIGAPVKGTRMPDGLPPGFHAHAWVEHAGVVLNDRLDIAADYAPFAAPAADE